MKNRFLDLPKDEQRKIIDNSSQKLGRSPNVIEKDLWICWVLEQLFKMPDGLKMAFKGGTSLSKVFRLINRFSEDIDITIDYRELSCGFDFFSETNSNTLKKKMSEELRVRVSDYVHNIVLPYFVGLMRTSFGLDSSNVKAEQNGKIFVYYPSIIEDNTNDYLGKYILIEFGGRNITEPNQPYIIHADMSELFTELEFPSGKVNVLSPLRTFWEKVTLIHVECQRSEFKSNANRLSRHWYDLYMLLKSEIGKEALIDSELLSDVIKYKKVFYNTAYANYDSCLKGRFKLVPGKEYLKELEIDYSKMLSSGMFYGEQTSFDIIMSEIEVIQNKINSHRGKVI